jgi:hypothetical protein
MSFASSQYQSPIYNNISATKNISATGSISTSGNLNVSGTSNLSAIETNTNQGQTTANGLAVNNVIIM